MVSFDLCEGNPGALSFMCDAYMGKNSNLGLAESAFQRMQDNNISGDKLYMIWNDCCDKDTEKALHVMRDNPIEDILYHLNYKQGRGIPY